VWIKYSCKYEAMLVIKPTKFKVTFTYWWNSLQSVFVGDCTAFNVVGKNGFFTIMLLLCRWGRMSLNSCAWLNVVDQAINILDRIRTQHSLPPPQDIRPVKRYVHQADNKYNSLFEQFPDRRIHDICQGQEVKLWIVDQTDYMGRTLYLFHMLLSFFFFFFSLQTGQYNHFVCKTCE
jgi:hypothetical protein